MRTITELYQAAMYYYILFMVVVLLSSNSLFLWSVIPYVIKYGIPMFIDTAWYPRTVLLSYASATFIAGTYTRSKAALYIEVPIA
jgi:ABC-type phosphate transport system permease subunit